MTELRWLALTGSFRGSTSSRLEECLPLRRSEPASGGCLDGDRSRMCGWARGVYPRYDTANGVHGSSSAHGMKVHPTADEIAAKLATLRDAGAAYVLLNRPAGSRGRGSAGVRVR